MPSRLLSLKIFLSYDILQYFHSRAQIDTCTYTRNTQDSLSAHLGGGEGGEGWSLLQEGADRAVQGAQVTHQADPDPRVCGRMLQHLCDRTGAARSTLLVYL